MRFVDTGRFQYEIEVDQLKDVKTGLREQYDELIAAGVEVFESGLCSNKSINKIHKILPWSFETIDALSEALEGLEAERCAVVYLLCQQLISETMTIAKTLGESEKFKNMSATRAARTSSEREAAISCAISSFGPSQRKRVQAIVAQVQARGHKISEKAVRERLKKSGV